MTKREMFDAIVEVCDSLGLDYTDYSGRAMYGEKCIGFVTDNYANDIFYVGKEMGKEYPDFDTDVRTDSMGLGTIVYFPWIKWYEEVDEDES